MESDEYHLILVVPKEVVHGLTFRKLYVTQHKQKDMMQPLKNDGWKMTIPLNWSLFRGHSFIFGGLTKIMEASRCGPVKSKSLRL